MSIIIYQVLGEFERYDKINFKIIENNCLFETTLISEAIYKCYSKVDKDVKVIFLIPQSLNKDYIKLQNLNIIKDDFKSKIMAISSIPDFDILIINSIGKYKLNENLNIDFENFPNNIALQIFLDLVKRTDEIKDNFIIYFDISTGHNIYISSIIDALRAIIIREKLKSDLKTGRIKASMTISEPIIGSIKKDVYNIYINDIDVKAFFELPFSYQEIEKNSDLANYIRVDNSLKEEISKECKDLSKKIKTLLENLLLAYNAIKYNIPLAFYYKDLINLKIDDFEDEVIKKFNEFLILHITDDKIYSYELDKNKIFNLFYSFSLYKLIKDSLANLKESSTDEIKKLFNDIYTKLNLGLNIRFLERDLNEIESKKKSIIKNAMTIDKILSIDKMKNSTTKENVQSDEKRNFFAHSGLERTMVEVRKDKDLVYINYIYNDNFRNKIYKWLKKPES